MVVKYKELNLISRTSHQFSFFNLFTAQLIFVLNGVDVGKYTYNLFKIYTCVLSMQRVNTDFKCKIPSKEIFVELWVGSLGIRVGSERLFR